jgi:hypothetical protein
MSGERVRDLLLEMARSRDARERVLAIGGLRGREGPGVMRALVEALGDPAWEVRAAAVDGLEARDDPAALTPLVDALAGTWGRLREDLVRTLQEISGAGIGDDPDQWRVWIRAHPAGRVPPGPVPGPPASACPTLGCPTGRTVYVVDLSGSMAEPVDAPPGLLRTLVEEGGLEERSPVRRIDLARAMLRRSVSRLRPEARFDVVALVDVPWAVRSELVPATAREVRRTLGRVVRLSPAGTTDVLAALRLALALRPAREEGDAQPVGADRIVVISEGYPSGAGVADRETILARTRETFLERRVRIDTVGVGACDVELLEGLARATGGRFLRVGE